MMTLDRFEDLAGLYGPDPASWPAAERGAARAFMTAHPDAARQALAQVSALNDLLESAREAGPDAALFEAVIASAPPARPAAPRWSAMAAAAALLVGVSAGWLTTGAPLTEEEVLFERAFAVLAEDETDWLEDAAR
ncbi:MAG: hypothetical protein LAT81_08135 [Oceanicaulis sp.]|nr:hypothetical protein [Oceanicaulis sp.]